MIKVNPGFSLIELLVVIGVISVVTGMAVPAFAAMIERRKLESAALSLQTDLQWARTLAIKQSQNILVSRTTGNQGAWCYGLAVKSSSKTKCDCNQSTAITSDDCELKRVSGVNYDNVDMLSAAVNNNSFDFRRGTISANGVTLATEHYAVRVVFSDTGRVRMCTPKTAKMPSDSTVGLPNVPVCL